MRLAIDPAKHMDTLFPTQVGVVDIPNAGRINPALEQAILQRHDSAPGVHHSNIGGWQSSADFTTWPEPEAADLVDSFRNAVREMIRLTWGLDRFDVEMFVGAWANVNRKGNFNQVHNHPENSWSGVYYVQAGNYSEDSIRNPGELHLHDPRERVEMLVHPGAPFGRPIPIAPQDGRMILFPSWLGHSVNVFYSDTRRISVALNAQILKLTPL